MRSSGHPAIIRKYLLLFLSAVFFAAGSLLESRVSCPNQAVVVTKKFEKRLHRQEALLEQYLEQVAGTIEQEDFDGNLQSAFHHLSSLFSKNGLGFLITDNQKLLFWSNQRFAFERAYLKQAPEEKVQFLPNGVYLSKVKKAGNLSVIGLIHLKETYPIRNDYIANRFAKGFDTPDTYKIEPEAPDHGVPVRNVHGEYIFSLVPGGKVLCEQSQLYLPALLFFTALILLLFFIRSFLKSNYTDEPFFLRMLVLALVLLGLYWIHVLFRNPPAVLRVRPFRTIAVCLFLSAAIAGRPAVIHDLHRFLELSSGRGIPFFGRKTPPGIHGGVWVHRAVLPGD